MHYTTKWALIETELKGWNVKELNVNVQDVDDFSEFCYTAMCYFQDGITPLHDAASREHASTCTTLITLGADINVKNKVSIHLKQSTELASATSQTLQAALKRIKILVSVVKTNSYV